MPAVLSRAIAASALLLALAAPTPFTSPARAQGWHGGGWGGGWHGGGWGGGWHGGWYGGWGGYGGYGYYGPGAAIASGLLGLAVGSVIGGVLAPPYYYAPSPVYYAPPPVYYPPPPTVYSAPPGAYYPAPYPPAASSYAPGYGAQPRPPGY